MNTKTELQMCAARNEALPEILRNSSKRHELLASLRDSAEWISSPETSAFQKYRMLTELVNMLIPSTLGLLTVNEFKELFGAILRSGPIDDALIVFINALHSYDNSQLFRLQHIIILLDDLEKTRLEALLIESVRKNPDDMEWNVKHGELCRLLGQTTCLVHNAFGDSHPSSRVKTNETLLEAYLNNHWIYVLKAVKAGLVYAAERCQNSEDVNLKFIAGVIYELSRGDIIVFRMLISWLELQAEDAIWSRISARLLTDSSNGLSQLESLLLIVLLATKNGKTLLKLFGNEIYKNRIVKRVFFEKALFVKVFSTNEKIPEKLAMCLHFGNNDVNEKGPWSTVHIETITMALNVWANGIHVNHSTDDQLNYIDVVLLNLVKHANEQIRHSLASEAITIMAGGVNIRLSSSNIQRRLRGMYVAEILTKWFSLGELKFEYPPEANEFTNDLKKIVDDEDVVDMEVTEDDNREKEKEVVKLEVQNIQDATGEVDSDDDDFPDYEIPEEELVSKKGENDEDYHRVEPVHYIRDCIERLNEQNDYAKFEVAFNALNPLIRRRAVGYEQSAEELLNRLINLSDRFNTENFQEKRQQLIVSCLVISPHLGNVAVDIMYSRSCSMTTRYIILKALSDAATEYSSPVLVVENNDVEVSKNEGKANVSVVSNSKELVNRTKRFGKAPIISKENRFTPVANSFFYPLSAIYQHREHLDLLGRDSGLLSRILTCMGHLVKCSGSCPCTVKMVSTLVHLLTPLRHHENYAVRQAVIFCYASICLSLSRGVLLHFYSDELSDWYEYTMKLAEADPSTECREMAQMAASTIARIVVFQDD